MRSVGVFFGQTERNGCHHNTGFARQQHSCSGRKQKGWGRLLCKCGVVLAQKQARGAGGGKDFSTFDVQLVQSMLLL